MQLSCTAWEKKRKYLVVWRNNVCFKIWLEFCLFVFWIALACTKIVDNCFLVIIVQLVGRLSQEELIDKLPTFLPALFDAFNNQSPDVRKVSAFIFPLPILYMTFLLCTDPFLYLEISWCIALVTYRCHFLTLDCCVLLGGYVHHAWESIRSILGRA
jgi:hypothetical protein